MRIRTDGTDRDSSLSVVAFFRKLAGYTYAMLQENNSLRKQAVYRSLRRAECCLRCASG